MERGAAKKSMIALSFFPQVIKPGTGVFIRATFVPAFSSPCFATLSAASLPSVPTWAFTHVNVPFLFARICFPTAPQF